MNTEHVTAEILTPMQAMFLPPRNMDEGAQLTALRGYADVLRAFAPPDLKTAWVEVVANHTKMSWPVPGVIVLAARKASKDRLSAQNFKENRGNPADRSLTDKRMTWDRTRESDLARRAAERGVAWSLKCAITGDGKQPNEIDLDELSRQHDAVRLNAARIHAGKSVMWNGSEMVLDEKHTAIYLRGLRAIELREAQTAEEIARFAKQAA